MLRYYVKPSGQYMGAASVPDGEDPQRTFNPLRDAGYIEVPEPAQSASWYWDFTSKTWFLPDSALMDIERSWRDAELVGCIWLRDRHRDQLELGVDTVLTAEQFTELLLYMQALRDWPQSGNFPASSKRPNGPVFLPNLKGEL